jgi:hypothetical protein
VRRVVVLGLVVLGVAACAGVSRWEKPGVSETERQRDETECAARASRETTETAERIARGPGSVPPTESRVSAVRDYDTALADECMQARGYKRTPVGTRS